MTKTTSKKQKKVPKGVGFMPGVDNELLLKTFMKERSRGTGIILKVCILRKEGKSIREISEQVDIPPMTAWSWLKRMHKGGLERRFKKKPPGRTRIIPRNEERYVTNCMKKPPFKHGFAAGAWNLDMVSELFKRKYKKEYRKRTLQRFLHRADRSYRKPRPIPDKSASPKEQAEFMNYANEITVQAIQNGFTVLSFDAAAFEKCYTGGYGWRLKGDNDTVPVTFSKATAKTLGVLGDGVFHIEVVDAINSDTVIDFLQKRLDIHNKYVIVLDNASCHKSKKMNDFIKSKDGKIIPIFLPPHTPQLNPIEMLWRELKRLLSGRYYKTLKDLKKAIIAIANKELKPVKLMSYMTERYRPNPNRFTSVMSYPAQHIANRITP